MMPTTAIELISAFELVEKEKGLKPADYNIASLPRLVKECGFSLSRDAAIAVTKLLETATKYRICRNCIFSYKEKAESQLYCVQAPPTEENEVRTCIKIDSRAPFCSKGKLLSGKSKAIAAEEQFRLDILDALKKLTEAVNCIG